MAKRIIDANALLEELDLIEMNTQISLKQGDKNYKLCQKGILSGLNWCRNIIYEIPTADAVEVRHGHWEVCSDEYEICASEFVCSICKESFCSSELTDEQFFEMMQYCPHCGARMDGDEDDL